MKAPGKCFFPSRVFNTYRIVVEISQPQHIKLSNALSAIPSFMDTYV